APETGRHHARLDTYVFDVRVRDIVGHVHGTVDSVTVDAVLERGRKPTRKHRRARYLVFPGDDLAVRQGGGNRVAIGRPVDVVPHILFTRPHDLDRARNFFGDAHGAFDHVGFEPAAEAAAEVMVIDRHLVDRDSRGLSRIFLASALYLRAGPDLTGARRQAHGTVHRLQHGMSEERQLVVGIEAFALRQAHGDVAFGFGDDAVLLARRAQVVPDVGGINLRVWSLVPGHFKRIEPLPGGPHVVADDSHEIVENDDLAHTGHFLRGTVVDMLDLAAKHRALGKRRKFHVRHHRVDAVNSFAVGFVRRVAT